MAAQQGICLIVGLGNPGMAYASTRHNIGFMVADELARNFSISFIHQKYDALIGQGTFSGIEIVLVKPMDYMNRSGPPVHALSRFMGIERQNILVIHDDMDLEFGRIKIKEKGGHGGHKGILSLIDVFGDGTFGRLRMGIGHPALGISVIDHVLGVFTPEESKRLVPFVVQAREAVETVLCKGTKESMNVFNRKVLS